MDIRNFFRRRITLTPKSRIVFPTRLTKNREVEDLYEKKLGTAKWCAKVLYANGAKRVWLFGSLAKGADIHQLTDIDIAVEGLKKPALDRTRRIIRSKVKSKVDIVILETANPGFRNSIMKSRILLSR